MSPISLAAFVSSLIVRFAFTDSDCRDAEAEMQTDDNMPGLVSYRASTDVIHACEDSTHRWKNRRLVGFNGCQGALESVAKLRKRLFGTPYAQFEC